MISRVVLLAGVLVLLVCCRNAERAAVVAVAGNRSLTRAEFQYWAGQPFESSGEAERTRAIAEWVEIAMIEQEAEASGVRNDPQVEQQVRRMLAQYYSSVLLARQAQPEITDSLIADYYRSHQSEFKRSTDSYLIEAYWSESEDSLRAVRQVLAKNDSASLRSGFVIREGRWLTQASELDAPLLAALRATEPGEFTSVLSFGEGYRLTKLIEVYPEGTQLTLEAVSQEIRERLLIEQSQRRQERWLTDLRNRYKPRIVKEGEEK